MANDTDVAACFVADEPQDLPDQSARILLSEGFSCAREFCDEVFAWVTACLAELQRDRVFTARQLAGREYWNQLDNPERQLAGRCIAHMVVHERLPLEFVKGPHEYPLRYRLK